MKLGWRIFIVVSAIGLGLYLSRKPWEVYRDQRSTAMDAQQAMREAEEERAKLMKTQMRLSNPIGKEQVMREQGWVKANETPAEK